MPGALAPVFAGIDLTSVAPWDIIPDVHGMADKLEGLLAALGYAEGPPPKGRASAWCQTDTTRKAVFLGDFIDRGPQQARVLDIARRMAGEGEALAVLGNHELNALHFAARHPLTAAPLRPHSPKNVDQHRAFLEAFPLESPAARDVLGWMQTLPLFLDLGSFRIAHAAWADPAIAEIRTATATAVLDDDLLVRVADGDDSLGAAVEAVAKGPEADLPVGFSFVDPGGVRRSGTRIAWWNSGAETWRGIAASVPDPKTCLPGGRASDEALSLSYSAEAPPVFVGHYWLTGEPAPRSHNVFCLDYSAGNGGPLVGYTQPAAGGTAFDLSRVTRSP